MAKSIPKIDPRLDAKITSEVEIPKVWRSETILVAMVLITSLLAVVFSVRFPSSVVVGDLWPQGQERLQLHLPIFWLVPAGLWILVMLRMYNVRYIASPRGLECVRGLLSYTMRVGRVRFEDIRSIETEQSVLERLLDIGRLDIATAATGHTEIVLSGISNPSELRRIIQRERDLREEKTRQPRNLFAA